MQWVKHLTFFSYTKKCDKNNTLQYCNIICVDFNLLRMTLTCKVLIPSNYQFKTLRVEDICLLTL